MYFLKSLLILCSRCSLTYFPLKDTESIEKITEVYKLILLRGEDLPWIAHFLTVASQSFYKQFFKGVKPYSFYSFHIVLIESHPSVLNFFLLLL